MRESLKQQKYDKQGKQIGVCLTIAVHALLFLVLGVNGFKTVYPPPAEKGILLEIPMEEVTVEQFKNGGTEPRAPKADPNKEIKLVQKSEAQVIGKKQNAGVATTYGDKGDVAKYEPVHKTKIDKRALFTSEDNHSKEEAAQTARIVSNALKAGHPDGNTNNGAVRGEPSVRLEGRSTVGSLPKPSYTVNKEGIVVVKIMVDQYGKVTNAIPGQSGTTVSDPTLWAAAKSAALKARFNINASASAVQIGTITYIFKLK